MRFLALLGRLFGGGIAGELRQAYEARLNAQNDQERIEADKVLAQLHARQGALAQGGMLSAWVQAAWALPFIIYNAKLILWDKVLGWGVTDPLSPELYQIQMIVVGFYFLTVALRR